MSDIQIVPIAQKYIKSFYQCLDSVARERAYLIFLEAPSLASVREFVEANIAQDVAQFVALYQGAVVGWCDILPNEYEGFRHSGRLGMGVHRNFRGRGIGTALITKTIEKARAKGLERIALEVFASNQGAIRLYEKFGFTIEGVQQKARKLDGIYDDVILMAIL